MRIGIDAHIITPKHKRYNASIATYTEDLIKRLIDAPAGKKHIWVLFFDNRMTDTTKFERPNVEIKHFPFIQYRTYLPVVYSHMLISGFLRSAKLDVFHSPEGLIPFLYGGTIITTFHHVPSSSAESNLFVRTVMLGARMAFSQLTRHAQIIVVTNEPDKKLLTTLHKFPEKRIHIMDKQTDALIALYEEIGVKKPKSKTKKARPSHKATAGIAKKNK